RAVCRLHVELLENRCLLATGLSASLVADLVPGAGSSSPANLTNVNGTLYFSASDPTNGVGLWKSDGTAAGSVLLKGNMAPPDYALSDFAPMNGLVFFPAYTVSSNNRTPGITDYTPGLWKTDGTTTGTALISSVPAADLTVVNGKLFFAGGGNHGTELWVSDG